MSWKPTDGQNRADIVVRNFAHDAEVAVALVLPEILRWRLFDAVSKTIDAALADGAEKGAMDNMIHVGKDGVLRPGRHDNGGKLFNDSHATTDAYGLIVGVGAPVSNLDDYSELPVAARNPVVEEHEEGPGAPSPLFTLDPLGLGDVQEVPMGISEPPAPKKRRGRPPGPSKGKKAKVKAAKAKKETAPVAPVAETVAATVTEPSEAPQ